ncbi:hypothetical protein [Nocardiopsis sp. LOL_012]|uniref:hypothetical protein n=1 Tax=Nocardiopsis sp. LOL_012 TaxID=3345409 RepID=UPI003A8815B6
MPKPTPPRRLLGSPQANAMFEVQENWSQVLSTLGGLVEQTRRSGFTRSQAHAVVAASFVAEVSGSEFVKDPAPGDAGT